MIVDASVAIDAVADPGERGTAAREALAGVPAAERLFAPGHFPIEVMSCLRAAANRPEHPLQPINLRAALQDVERLEIALEAPTWSDVRRAWHLAECSLRYADAVYVAAAERHHAALLTADARIARSGAPVECEIVTIGI